MREFELAVPKGDVVEAVEAQATSLGLAWMRSSLKKYPDSTHWHFVMPDKAGTLEATWWPAKNRLWLSVHENRQAEWQEPAIRALEAWSNGVSE